MPFIKEKRKKSMIKTFKKNALVTYLGTILATTAFADTVKIGMITTLSTGGGYLGQDIYDGFQLAIKQNGGKLGGQNVEVLVEDDGRKPGVGKQVADRYIKRDGIDILTGIVFSNVAGAVVPSIMRQGKIYVSPNAAPGIFAGKQCNPNYFVTAWQNNTLHETAGFYANEQKYKTAYVMAPNYLAGKDAVTGFKSAFKGQIVGESFVKLGQTDYATELAKIRKAKPDMVFQFLPGAMGINFLKQYAQGEFDIPQVVSFTALDQKMTELLGEAVVGVRTTAHWSQDFDNPISKKFIADFQATYGRMPTIYASQGYDTANWIGSALKATGGDTNPAKIASALKQLRYTSVRGAYKLANNNHPTQDWYGRIVVKNADGSITHKTVGKVASNLTDHFATQCKQ